MPKPRLQGTDGVRGLAAPGDHPLAEGMDPVQAYSERGLLTERFAEIYAYAASRWLLERAPEGLISPGAVVVAWDPRDEEGRFYQAVTRGVVRSGAHVLVTGILPTPAAALYMAGVGAAGALVLTASHNPSDQNGIKIFLGPDAMKPLPAEDEELSARVWDTSWEEVEGAPPVGDCTDTASEARSVYADHLRELPNCWLRKGDLSEWDIVLDPARGAWCGLAYEVVSGLGPGSLTEVNRLGEGLVNEGGGVVALEGRISVAGGEEEFIRGHAGLRRLFEAGRERADDLRAGKGFAVSGVFDADGDRAYTLVYDPFADSVRVLGGDESLILQARFLKAEEELPEGSAAALTIESDAGAAAALTELGLSVSFTPVGDKWILRAAGREGVFACGGEESGHTVVPGRFSDALGRARLIAVGDGLKSFLNTCAAIRRLAGGADPRAVYGALAEPFPRGYKKTLYAYHVDRRRFAPGSEAWEAARSALEAATLPEGARPRWAPLEDDPAVLYLALEDSGGRPVGAIYVRNSGTERKTGVILRGPAGWDSTLREAGEAALRGLLIRMKDENDPSARAEEALLERLASGPADAAALDDLLMKNAEVRPGRIRKEALRGGLISNEGENLTLTGLGRWYTENRSRT